MIRFRFAALAWLPVMAAFAALTACGGGTSAPNGQGTKAAGAQSQAVTIHYKLVGSDDDQARVGPDGQKHDTLWAVDPTTVHVGDKITIVVEDYDDMPHGMVFTDLWHHPDDAW